MGKMQTRSCLQCLSCKSRDIHNFQSEKNGIFDSTAAPSVTSLICCTEQFPYSLGSDHTNCFLLFILFWHQTRSRRCPTQGRDARDLINYFPSFDSEIPPGQVPVTVVPAASTVTVDTSHSTVRLHSFMNFVSTVLLVQCRWLVPELQLCWFGPRNFCVE